MKYNSKNIVFAKYMRSNMTKEEVKLWNILRARRFYGFKFKRQVLIGDYIVDFICETEKLIIEVDGGHHNEIEKIKYDSERTEFLQNLGYKVIRFWNNEIWDNIEGVCEKIKNTLNK